MRPRHAYFFLIIVLLASVAAGCPNQKITLPAAQTPVLESILDVHSRTNAIYHHHGSFIVAGGTPVELRLRAPWPSTVGVKVNDVPLSQVSDTAAHPELEQGGYYRISAIEPVSAQDPLFFWRLYIVIPSPIRSDPQIRILVTDTSNDPNKTGKQKEADPLSINIFHAPVQPSSPRPSHLFFSVADAKHSRSGGDAAVIKDNITLAGWLAADPGRGLDDPATEDWHYDIFLDNDFLQRNYPTINDDLDGAIIPGRWYTELDAFFHPNLKIPLTNGVPTADTFLMPGTGLFTVELNAWHPSRHGGNVPSGWVGDPVPSNTDIKWPFPVLRPLGTDSDLHEGDYVIIMGTLVEDSAHLHWAAGETPSVEDRRHECWFHNFQGHGGWLEIHPLDAIRRIPATQAPVPRKQPYLVQACREDPSLGTPLLTDRHLTPVPATPPTDHSVLRYVELIDGRFTNMNTVQSHIVEINPATQTDLHVYVQLKANGKAYFKATYLLWWEESSQPRPSPVQKPTPSKSSEPPDIPPICQKKPYLPQCGLKDDSDQDRDHQ
jgi:hypothetical protein